jgi:hypothetical protein
VKVNDSVMDRLYSYITFAILTIIYFNIRGFLKSVLKMNISKNEEYLIENMLLPNLYKWVCISSTIFCIFTFIYYLANGLTDTSFKILLVNGILFIITEILRVAQNKKSKSFDNSLIMIIFYIFIFLLFTYMIIF